MIKVEIWKLQYRQLLKKENFWRESYLNVSKIKFKSLNLINNNNNHIY